MEYIGVQVYSHINIIYCNLTDYWPHKTTKYHQYLKLLLFYIDIILPQNYEKPDSVDAEAQTALDIDGLALTLSNTCLGEEISYKNTQIARLKDAIESDQLELKELESKKAQLEKDVSDKEAALSSIKSCMEAQARKLKDTVEEVSQQEHRNQQLQDTYKVSNFHGNYIFHCNFALNCWTQNILSHWQIIIQLLRTCTWDVEKR